MAVVPECDVLAFVLNGKDVALENVNGLSLPPVDIADGLVESNEVQRVSGRTHPERPSRNHHSDPIHKKNRQTFD